MSMASSSSAVIIFFIAAVPPDCDVIVYESDTIRPIQVQIKPY